MKPGDHLNLKMLMLVLWMYVVYLCIYRVYVYVYREYTHMQSGLPGLYQEFWFCPRREELHCHPLLWIRKLRLREVNLTRPSPPASKLSSPGSRPSLQS